MGTLLSSCSRAAEGIICFCMESFIAQESGFRDFRFQDVVVPEPSSAGKRCRLRYRGSKH